MSPTIPIEATRPKLLLIGQGFGGGGAEGRFANIAVHLFDGEPDVAVLAQTRTPQRSGPVMDLKWRGPLSYGRAIWMLMRQIRRERYQVVMAFGFAPNVIATIAGRCANPKTKIIISEITRPRIAAKSGGGWRSVVYTRLRRLLYRRADVITANSIDGLAETCELAGIPETDGIRVVNTIDVEGLTRQASSDVEIGLPIDRFIICVGRLDFMKRLDVVIQAMAQISPTLRCSLVIVGDGIAREALATQVAALGLGQRVMFTGWLDNPFPLLKKAAAFVLASEYEGYSNALLEAMFCDVPVITSLCSSDAEEMCRHGAALGFEVGDSGRLAELIRSITTDETRRKEVVERARIYRAPHALPNAIPLYEQLIRRVASGPVVDAVK